MKKFAFFLIIFLALLAICIFISWQNADEEDIEIDITDTGFEYDVAICDKYYKLVGCIIDNDHNQSWDQQMRQELKSQIKVVQEEWKQFNEEELVKKCTDELEKLKFKMTEKNLDSFGCLTGI